MERMYAIFCQLHHFLQRVHSFSSSDTSRESKTTGRSRPYQMHLSDCLAACQFEFQKQYNLINIDEIIKSLQNETEWQKPEAIEESLQQKSTLGSY